MPRLSQPARVVHGLHHITAIAGPAQENLDFYAGVLGMRLVKRSVNQDDPGTYHLFYADAVGHPGSDLTFFPWDTAATAAHRAWPRQRGQSRDSRGHDVLLGGTPREVRLLAARSATTLR
jgi:catechol 2,3-dioxygenase-like lactoylglutathione lyase family enzyme